MVLLLLLISGSSPRSSRGMSDVFLRHALRFGDGGSLAGRRTYALRCHGHRWRDGSAKSETWTRLEDHQKGGRDEECPGTWEKGERKRANTVSGRAFNHLTHSFIPSFFHSFIHSFIHSFRLQRLRYIYTRHKSLLAGKKRVSTTDGPTDGRTCALRESLRSD